MKLRRWIWAGAGAGAGYLVARRLFGGPVERWERPEEQAGEPLAGDELLADAEHESTLALPIEASPEEIWPWLAQMGTGRAGWYTLDWLGGGDNASAEEIVPAYQDLHVGDTLAASSDGATGLRVAQLERERSLVLQDLVDTATGEAKDIPGGVESFTWAFIIEPTESEATRLITRLRARRRPTGRAGSMLDGILPLVHMAIQRGQLINLKERAEALARAPLPEPPTPSRPAWNAVPLGDAPTRQEAQARSPSRLKHRQPATTAPARGKAMAPVVVAGATGTVGSHVARQLHERGHRVRGVTHRTDARPPAPEIEMVVADLRQVDDARRALAGASSLYLAPPEQGADPLETERRITNAVFQAALDEELEHVVLHTALHADRPATGVPLLDAKKEMEERMRELGLPWTVLRPGLLLEPLLQAGFQRRRDTLSLPFEPGHHVGIVPARDVASACVGLLLEGPQKDAFDLHLPGGLSGDDLARILSDVYDRSIAFKPAEKGLDLSGNGLGMGPRGAELYQGLLAYAAEHTYLGSPERISKVLDGFSYTALERVVHEDLDPRRQARWSLPASEA